MADGAANPLPVPTGASKTPSDFLKSIKGKPVLVKLNSGVDYRGRAA
jgi:U6 snRNA-associated Sm-like protein LSm6